MLLEDASYLPISSATKAMPLLIKWVDCCYDVWCLVWMPCVACPALRMPCVALPCVAMRCVVMMNLLWREGPYHLHHHGLITTVQASLTVTWLLRRGSTRRGATHQVLLQQGNKYVRHKPSIVFHLNIPIWASHWLFTAVAITSPITRTAWK